eukprot:4650999-Pyramimonas_sp.AAC.1
MQFANFFAILLMPGGALCSMASGIDPDKDSTNLYLSVVLSFAVVMITATFSYLQEDIMEAFKKLIPKQTRVTRKGTVSVDAAEHVPRDGAMGQTAGLAMETATHDSISTEIKKFINLISAVAIVLGVTFFIIGISLGTSIIKNVVMKFGIIVANVPEGLLATVSLSFALAPKRMYEKNVLVMDAEVGETLGSTTVIISNKTGPMTQNRTAGTTGRSTAPPPARTPSTGRT